MEKHNQEKRLVLIKGHYASLVNHTFQTLLVTYLILLLLEEIAKGFVSTYLNLNYLLIIVILAGVLDVFSETPVFKKKDKTTKFDYIFIIILGILGFAIIKYKTIDLGFLSWLISIIAGVLIFLLSILILEEDDDKKTKDHNLDKWSEKHDNVHEKSKYPLKKIITISTASTIIILVIISLTLFIFTEMGILESLRVVFGSLYVLFLPGFILSFVFFPVSCSFETSHKKREKGAIDFIERIALSFALSIAIVPLAVFYLNLVGVKINTLNSFLIILGIIIISSIILFFRIKKLKIK